MEYLNQTLDSLSQAPRFNRWIFEQVQPYCGQNNLEIGSGYGNLSRFFFEAKIPLVLSDVAPHYLQSLKQNFQNQSLCQGIKQLDIAQELPPQSSELKHYDCIFALNVFEHLEDDVLALQNCSRLLKDQGFLIILLPAYPKLYNHWDKELGHYRRYRPQDLPNYLSQCPSLRLHRLYAFNAGAILGWWLFGSVLKRPQIPQGPLAWYDRLVPLWRGLDRVLGQKIGISQILIAQKISSSSPISS